MASRLPPWIGIYPVEDLVRLDGRCVLLGADEAAERINVPLIPFERQRRSVLFSPYQEPLADRADGDDDNFFFWLLEKCIQSFRGGLIVLLAFGQHVVFAAESGVPDVTVAAISRLWSTSHVSPKEHRRSNDLS